MGCLSFSFAPGGSNGAPQPRGKWEEEGAASASMEIFPIGREKREARSSLPESRRLPLHSPSPLLLSTEWSARETPPPLVDREDAYQSTRRRREGGTVARPSPQGQREEEIGSNRSLHRTGSEFIPRATSLPTALPRSSNGVGPWGLARK